MTTPNTHLDQDFIESQKARLLKLRDELQHDLSAAADDATEERKGSAEARELEDDAQKLDALERDGLLEHRAGTRLESINRALQRIENGSYGISTVSGKPIARARLEAVPEAQWNTHEQPESK